MDFWASADQWQRFLTLPIVGLLFGILRRMHPLRLLQRLLSFGIGVTEREMLLAMIEAEKASGLRWKAQWDICQSDLQAADDQAARLRTRLATLDDSGGGGT
jgi:hypothetical protein